MAITSATGVNYTNLTVSLAASFPTAASVAYSQDEPGQSILTNVTSAIDQPSSIRTSVQAVADVFKKANCNPVPGQILGGVDILTQLVEVWKMTDNVLGTSWYLPVSARAVYTLPTDPNISALDLTTLVARLAGCSCRAVGDTIGAQLQRIQRGVTRL